MQKITVPTQVFTALIVAQILMLLVLYNTSKNNSILPTGKPEKTHILILSSWRSGSSFVGQIFSQHPDTFYLMEPAWHVWRSLKESNAKVLHMASRDLIRSVFQCDMSVFDSYLPEKKTISNLFKWAMSRALCSPPACELFKRTDIITEKACKTVCRNGDFSKAEQACQTYSHVVIKEVRFFNWRVLYSLLTDPFLNVKIIHLIRDPRAVFCSRNESTDYLSFDSSIILNKPKKLDHNTEYKVMKEVCKSHEEIYQAAHQMAPKFMKDHYMMIRYEDLSRDPLSKVKEMYSFANLDLTPKLEAWIYNSTHGNRHSHGGFQTTARDALNVSQAWRNNLPFQVVSKVQDLCQKSMALLGYKLVHSAKEQKLLSMDLLLP
ncbi:carbohydrate sulfotransferase 5-like [Protopterus annectens]|uniref:carbohydrate sulfotransferase 5-like n=1 Tax=Protopterus annectens TaxID=7888 RepID=UPI001CFA6875|nr:carbohydrate sulfotransferase 5-like [Protopterus annectens]XP_043935031.1 carbohydrate sulfotransferase 5-like [Protopterus annectens]XP_043935032.1 carbohydrate sulfotransferase 5-like [Protopterus annectens]